MLRRIDPLKVTDFNRTQHALEYFWLYAIICAGKNSDWASDKIFGLFESKTPHVSPLNWLWNIRTRRLLERNRVGQYDRVTKAITQSKRLDLREDSRDNLEAVFGVGFKTSRFFILHSRADAECIPLDTHILKRLRKWQVKDVPPSTPTSEKEYLRLEKVALKLIPKYFPNCTLAEADLLIWSQESGRIESEN